ncbi:M23 family metallopeptidase [Clostridium sp. A1-XYC3]|uniref:M23 family metallopeptidase n=1 Tax=Clostridium tanneri TaxID=3037988 RepID=A0ABU4JUG6_9CLOT|nr:M23 family metallopeptidase [Clostridium sp. A1-XYC3]MDW8801584.1 M23 family metallopeptidase [Clostridium sp. A1-XYC3]
MLWKHKAKIVSVILAIIMTTVVTLQYIYYNRPYAYEVYINNKHLAYIKNKQDFYDVKNGIEKEIEKRYGKFHFNDQINFKNVLWISDYKLKDKNELRKDIVKVSNTTISAFLMKSDGKPVGILASEEEMKKVLDTIKDTYSQGSSGEKFRLKSKVTYIKQNVTISQLQTVQEIVNNLKESKNSSIIAFSKESDKDKSQNVRPSRSSSLTNIMQTPSRGVITSSFGARWGKMHNGIDIGSPMGDPIHAAMDGKVYYAGWENGYGNIIKIEHESGIQTFYGHCSKISVKEGQYVKSGEKIGEVGSTGRSTGPHVHFEVRVEGVPKNPLAYIK